MATLKAAYAGAAVLFTWLLGRLTLIATSAQATRLRVAQAAVLLGVSAVAVAWLGWVLGRRLGLSRANSAAVAVGSVMGGVNVAVLAWVMLTREPGERPPA
jgi:putative Mn2+ efflux pump MntP